MSTDGWVLVLADLPRAQPLADAIRAAGLRATVVSTVSELRDTLAGLTRPTVVVVDTCIPDPWRWDAVDRMTSMAAAASLRVVRVGDVAPNALSRDDARHVLPGDASLATVVSTVVALHVIAKATESSTGGAATDERAPVPA